MKKLLITSLFLVVGLIAKGQKNDLSKALSFEQKADSFALSGKYKDAMGYYQKAAPIFDKQNKFAHYFKCRINTNVCLEKTSQYKQAFEILNQLLKHPKVQQEQKRPYKAKILSEFGKLYYIKNDFSKSKSYFIQALASMDQPNDRILIALYNDFGLVYQALGKLDSALVYHQQALKVRKKMFGEKHQITAESYNNLGTVYFDMADYKKAIYYDQKTLAIRREVLNEKHPHIALSYNNIGGTYKIRGDYDTALKYFQKSLEIRKESLGEQHIDVGQSYYNMGIIYSDIEAYNLAVEFFQKYLAILKKTVGEKHIYVANVYTDLGLVYLNTKRYEKALNYYQKAIKILKQVLPKENRQFMSVYNEFGNLYRHKKDYKKAISYYKKALNIGKKIDKSPHITTGEAYLNLGVTYAAINKSDSVIQYFQHATTIFEKALSYKSRSYSHTLFELGKLYFTQKKYTRALQHLQKSLPGRTIQFSDTTNIYALPASQDVINDPFVLHILDYQARCFFKLYNNTQKPTYLNQALKIYDLGYRLIPRMQSTFSKSEDKLSFKKAIYNLNEGAFITYLKKYEASKDQRLLEQLFKFSEQFKASILTSTIAQTKALKFAHISDRLIKQEKNLKLERTYWQKQIVTHPTKATQYQDSLFKYNRAYEALITQLEAKYPKYAQLKYQNNAAKLSEIQQKLNNETLILSYVLGQESSYLIVISKKQAKVIPLVSEQKLAPLFDQYYSTLASESRLKNFARASYQLYQKLVQPAKKYLKGKKRLLIIAPSLESIPFEALITQKPSSSIINNDNFSQLRYLVNQYEISYHYSVNLWHQGVQTSQKITPKLIAFAPFSTGKSETVSTSSRSSVDPLPESGIEVKTIFNLFNNKKLVADIFLANAATKERFIEKTKDYNIVHIASHSEANTKNANLAKVRFAGCDNSKADASGCLLASEVYNLSLNADLLVLSSCESGVGKLAKGEGVLSLARSFLYAGARNIVFSLWDVNDVHTRKLMEVFYKELLSGKRYRQALQQAQQQMLSANKRLHPKHWTGFVMIGE